MTTDDALPANHEDRPLRFDIEEDRCRLDRYMAAHLPHVSRTQIARMIREKRVRINGNCVKPSYEVRRGDVLEMTVAMLAKPTMRPESAPLDILYEDEHIIAVNKPAGWIVHPGHGHWHGTLANALLAHCGALSNLYGADRPGIVHRLDRNTSGLMIAAKNNPAHHKLGMQFQHRLVKKSYLAILEGVLQLDADQIDLPIGRHRRDREKMAVRLESGKGAVTRYRVLERFDQYSLVEVLPETGRTHQIRVHMAHLGHPVLCDGLYGYRDSISASDLLDDPVPQEASMILARQALHAWKLQFTHPVTGARMALVAGIAPDLCRVLQALHARLDTDPRASRNKTARSGPGITGYPS